MKNQTNFVCQQCGYSTPQWFGKCPSCGEWNSLVEFKDSTKVQRFKGAEVQSRMGPKRLNEIRSSGKGRISTGIVEFDRVVGGGLVTGSVVLLAGEPGIGKSTLLLQLAETLGSERKEAGSGVKEVRSESGGGNREVRKILYISGEESAEQIKIRAERLGIKTENLFLMNETNVEAILEEVSREGSSFVKTSEDKEVPQVPREGDSRGTRDTRDSRGTSLIIVDSIQTLYSEDLEGTAGSIGQVRECAARLINFCKPKGIPLILVGQVTKEGAIAGPMTLAHMVDTVLFLEGERFQSLRLLRGIKNRFGPTDEVGVFEMTEKGMMGVENPSKLFLGESKPVPGSVTFCAMEGTRPILVEIQALVTKSFLAMPRRVANGLDYNRLVMLTAVLQKSLSLPLWDQDIYLNIAGGFKVSEPAADLAVCLAIISSFKNKPMPPKTCAFGEVGLLGEIRRVAQEEKREKEGRRMGFTNLITSGNCRNLFTTNKNFGI